MNNLLSKAKKRKQPPRKSSVPEKAGAALAVAWAIGEITYTQAMYAVDRPSGAGVYAVLACGLRDAVRLGMLVKA